MAKRIFDLYRDARQLLGQHRSTLTPQVFSDALAWASRGLFDDYYGNVKQYPSASRPVPRVAYQVTTAVASALHPFLREVRWGRDAALLAAGFVTVGPDAQQAKYLKLDVSGRLALPADCVHPTSWAVPGAVELVTVLDDNEVEGAVLSLIAPPDLTHPMLGLVQGGLLLLGGASELRATYLGFPARPKYAVEYPDPDGPPVYSDADSIDVDWPASRDNQLLARLVQYPALGVRDPQVLAAAKDMEVRGS